MKKLFILLAILSTFATMAQSVVINADGSTANAAAMLDVSSTTKGFLPPRLTYAQRNAIASPAAGLIVWCTDCGGAGEMQVNNGTTWTNVVGGTASGNPGAPTSPVATAGNAQASVAFNPPASTGVSAITGYTVTSSPGGFTSTGASSPIVVTGLTNGTAYTFTVVATNAAGNSSASIASGAVTPFTVPGAPISPVATAGNAQASVAFNAPASNGGSAITGYTVTSSPGGFTATGASSPLIVTGLTNGMAYTFTVLATSAVGNSVASTASAAVTPRTVPGAPTSPMATAGNAQASVAFNAPVSNGGSAITSYTVTSSPGSFTATGASSPLVVTGLTNGTAYTFTVVATNVAGNSVATSASAAATPITVPDAPTSSVATEDNAQASVAFNAPASNGGSAITGYTVTSSPGGFTSTGASSPLVVTGLTNGMAYTFTVVATSAVGNSVASIASAAVTPRTVPGAPTSPVATAGNAQASVAFTTPVSNGGSAITSYTVTSSPGSFTATGASSPLTVTGLTNLTSYTFTVVATNAAGNSSASLVSVAVTPETTCFVLVAAGVTKQFLCHNLGANTSLDPHVPVVGLQGAYIQWGRRGPNSTGDSRIDWQTPTYSIHFAKAPTSATTNQGFVMGWSSVPATNSSWGATKTTDDPCPTGYRVPTSAEWTGVNSNNTVSRTGTFVSSSTQYGSALHFGPNASTKLLTLPAAGYRDGSDGSLNFRGSKGNYWSSTVNGTNSFSLTFDSSVVFPASSINRTLGFSLRCVEE